MIVIRACLILLLSFILLSCSNGPDNSRVSTLNTDVHDQAISSPVTIVPHEATRKAQFTLKAERSILTGGKIHWYINEGLVESAQGYRFSSNDLNKGDRVKAIVKKDEQEFMSNEITIKNSPPAIADAKLSPRIPRVDSVLQINVKARDADNDIVSYSYEWALNGNFAGEENYLEATLKRGDKISISITPYDGDESGKQLVLKSSVYNSLPVFSESSPSFTGDTYEYHVSASDPDNDLLTYSLLESPDGMTIDPSSGVIKWKVSHENEGLHEIKVLVDDNHGGKIIVPFTTRIGFAQNGEQST
ncbi:MAG: cadherin repeat domain-containing protein [Nitrospirota bacterium]